MSKAIPYRHEDLDISVSLQTCLDTHYRYGRICHAFRLPVDNGPHIHAVMQQAPTKPDAYLAATVNNDGLVYR